MAKFEAPRQRPSLKVEWPPASRGVVKQEHVQRSFLKHEATSLKAKIEAVKQESATSTNVNNSASAFSSSLRAAALLQRGLQFREQLKAEQSSGSTTKREVKSEVKKERKVSVKQEQKKKSTRKASKGKRRRGPASAAKRQSSREVINREVELSRPLASLLGAPALSRPEAVKRLWAHCKAEGMLNPDDKREIIFSDNLRSLFGKDKAKMTDLFSVLMPHFLFSSSAGDAPSAPNNGDTSVKSDSHTEMPIPKVQKKEENIKWERLLKGEALSNTFLKAEEKCLPKRELSSAGGTTIEIEDDEVPLLRAENWVPKISSMASASVVLEVEVPDPSPWARACTYACCGAAIGTGVGEASSPPNFVRSTAEVKVLEGEGGQVLHVEARLSPLDPARGYRFWIEAADPGRRIKSAEVEVPQRSNPEKWKPTEAQQWCASLRIPELQKVVVQYCMDGSTLLALQDEDLKSLGLAAPFLLRRYRAAVEAIKAPKASPAAGA
mmetsp:Transcript_34393/g.73241  ORF Transcript_34393/g.73241 Transcript_34393/m.73241 type:complete len:495 (+) Transcript_34393:49-1533(+)